MKALIILLVSVVVSLSFAQTKNDDGISITKTRDFTVLGIQENENTPMRYKLNIKATYSSTNGGQIVLNLYGKKDSINYPLDFYYYQLTMQKLLDSNSFNYTILYQSDLEIFHWLNGIALDKNTQPLAGTLHMNSFVQVFDKFNLAKNEADHDRTIKIINQKQTEIKKNVVALEKIHKLEYPATSNNSKTVKKELTDKQPIKKIELPAELQTEKSTNQTQLEESIKVLNLLKVYRIDDIQLQFEGGFIERIQVTVNFGDYYEIFENSFPIGFSSIPNFEEFSSIKLYARGNKNGANNYILLSNVIYLYDNDLQLKTRDYSPADTIIRIKPMSNPLVKLYKQHSKHIIDGKAYTDLNGFSEKSPNGLVQIELSRRFLMNTKRIQFQRQINFGFFTYLDIQTNYSKIENKLKGLPLRNAMVIENQAVVSPSYAANLDFIRYENLSFKAENNILIWDIPHFKTSWFFDLGLRYGHTPVTDTIFTLNNSTLDKRTIDFSAHSFMIFPKVKIQVFAERRYGLTCSYQFNVNRIFSNNNFKQVLSYSGKGNDLDNYSNHPATRYSHTIEAMAYFDANPKDRTGKLFALARFHLQHRDLNTFFPQILLGYAFSFYN